MCNLKCGNYTKIVKFTNRMLVSGQQTYDEIMSVVVQLNV